MLDRGLLQVYTGDGKGKTTAATGLAVRALGTGMRVCFVQFVKGGERSGELEPLERLGARVERPAILSTGLLASGPTDADRDAAEQTWSIAEEVLSSGEWDLVVLDEVNVAVSAGLGSARRLLRAVEARPEHVEVVCTGRGASEEILQAADLITEMVSRKHPLEAGIGAREGIEY